MKKIGVIKRLNREVKYPFESLDDSLSYYWEQPYRKPIEVSYDYNEPLSGTIITDDGAEYGFVNQSIVEGCEDWAFEGSFVTFEVDLDSTNCPISNIRLFSTEPWHYIVKNIECINSIDEKKRLAKMMPDFVLEKNEKVRKYLSEERFVSILTKLMSAGISLEESKKFTEEIINYTNDLSYISSELNFDQLPDSILESNIGLRKFLSEKRVQDLYIKMAKDFISDPISTLSLKEEIEGFLKDHRDPTGKFIERLPENYLLQDGEIRKYLSIDRYMEIIMPLINLSSPELRSSLLSEVRDKILSDNTSYGSVRVGDKFDYSSISNDYLNQSPSARFIDGYWVHIPYEIIREKVVWEVIPPGIKIFKIVKVASSLEEIDVEEIKNILESDDVLLRWEEIIKLVPETLFVNNMELFSLLYPREQVELIIKHKMDIGELWPILKNDSRIMLLYECIKSNIDYSFVFNETVELGIELQCVILLLQAKLSQTDKYSFFMKVHKLITDYVIENAWTEYISFPHLLPDCLMNYGDLCEGIPFLVNKNGQTSPEAYIFCKRNRCYCQRFDPKKNVYDEFGLIISKRDDGDYTGARVWADSDLEWYDWSILEILDYAKIEPQIEGIEKPLEYIPRICGWINRANDIVRRLKCGTCNGELIPNKKYSLNLIGYNSISASCQHGVGHDHDVYLTHCWACGQLLDSRESRIKIDGFHLCVICGGGPKDNSGYKIGDLCPKCGSATVVWKYDGVLQCTKCEHSFFPRSGKKFVDKYIREEIPKSV